MLRNFTWVIPQQLAGMALPTSAYRIGAGGKPNAELKRDLVNLKHMGVDSILSLTSDSLDSQVLDDCGFQCLHLPVEDMAAPTPSQIRQAVLFIDEHIEQGGVVVHCMAGIGRTGTVLAGYLVWQGYSPEVAITEIREKRPGSIETISQESTIFSFAEAILRHDA